MNYENSKERINELKNYLEELTKMEQEYLKKIQETKNNRNKFMQNNKLNNRSFSIGEL